jgi:hypothetical protein
MSSNLIWCSWGLLTSLQFDSKIFPRQANIKHCTILDHVEDFYLLMSHNWLNKNMANSFLVRLKTHFSIDFLYYLFLPSHGFNGARTFAAAPAIPGREYRTPCWPRIFWFWSISTYRALTENFFIKLEVCTIIFF